MDTFRCILCRELYLRSINFEPDFHYQQIFKLLLEVLVLVGDV